MPAKKTHEDFLSSLRERNILYPNKKVFLVEGEKYSSIHSHIMFQCEKDHIWHAPPTRILQGKWCPICSRKDVGKQNQITNNKFLKTLEIRNEQYPDKKVLLVEGEIYHGTNVKLKWKCHQGHIWEAIPKTIIRGSYCPECRRLNNINLHTNEFLLTNKKWLLEQHHMLEKSITSIASEIDSTPDTIGKYCRLHNIEIKRFTHSTSEKEINDFINSLGIETKTNIHNIIPPYELDIYVPKFQLAIEYCGLYWHSDIHERINKNYHQEKTLRCHQKGIRLITIFSDEWELYQQKVKDTLKHFLGKSEKGVYGRNVIIKKIDWKQAKDFLNQYHLLNAGQPGTYRIGAFDNSNNLVGVMVFGNRCSEGTTNEIELKRFVTNKKNNPGVGSKMFNWAVINFNLSRVVAFVDLRWFNGEVKDHIGFKQSHITSPTFYWVKKERRFNRTFITKKKLNQLDVFKGQNLTKREMMKQMGYTMVWDCGKFMMVWEKINPN